MVTTTGSCCLGLLPVASAQALGLAHLMFVLSALCVAPKPAHEGVGGSGEVERVVLGAHQGPSTISAWLLFPVITKDALACSERQLPKLISPPVGDGSRSEEKVQSKVIKGLGELRCEMSNLEKAQVSFGRGSGDCGASLLVGREGHCCHWRVTIML